MKLVGTSRDFLSNETTHLILSDPLGGAILLVIFTYNPRSSSEEKNFDPFVT